MIDENIEEIRRRLAEVMTEHRDLDEVIARMGDSSHVDQLMMQRLKKRKLALKDQIAQLENQLIPDIIA
ncbi:MAG: YdcH family protein [Solirubrobacterales bacterium]